VYFYATSALRSASMVVVTYKNTQLTAHGVVIFSMFVFYKVSDAAFNVTHFESRITHLLYTAINATEHG
jgi:hypothetical protein